MSIALEIFYLAVAVTMPLAAELSVFVGVGSWVKPILWGVICMRTAVCPFWNNTPTSSSAADATTCLRILHSVWIGPFSGGWRFGFFSGWLVVSRGNSDPQCGCMPLDLIGMMHHCQCEVSYR